MGCNGETSDTVKPLEIYPHSLVLRLGNHSSRKCPGLWMPKKWHRTETANKLNFLSHLSGEGNGSPLQYSCLENPMDGGAWWAAVHGVARIRTQLRDFTFTFHFQALEKEMATHSSVLAWRIPGMGEPGGLPSLGSHRVGHDWSDLAAAAVTCHRRVTTAANKPSRLGELAFCLRYLAPDGHRWDIVLWLR